MPSHTPQTALTHRPQGASPVEIPPPADAMRDELAYLQDWYDRRVPLLSGLARIRQIRRALPPQLTE